MRETEREEERERKKREKEKERERHPKIEAEGFILAVLLILEVTFFTSAIFCLLEASRQKSPSLAHIQEEGS